MFAPRTLKYWREHHNIKVKENPDYKVDWQASQLAIQKLPQGSKRWLSKQTSGHIGVGHMLKNENGKLTHAAHSATKTTKKLHTF